MRRTFGVRGVEDVHMLRSIMQISVFVATASCVPNVHEGKGLRHAPASFFTMLEGSMGCTGRMPIKINGVRHDMQLYRIAISNLPQPSRPIDSYRCLKMSFSFSLDLTAMLCCTVIAYQVFPFRVVGKAMYSTRVTSEANHVHRVIDTHEGDHS